MFFRKHQKIVFILLLIVLAAAVFTAATVGSAKVPFSDVMKILFPFLSKGGAVSHNVFKVIILKIRLPRIFLAVITGMGLAVSGAVFQGIFRNPMANPYILGISSGAAFAVAMGMALGLQATVLGMGAISISAFLGGFLTSLVVYFISGGGKSVFSLLLSGIAIGFFLSALMSLVMYLNRNQIENIVYWTMGSFNASTWTKVAVSAPVIIIGAVLLMFFSKDLNIMVTGDDSAKSLGIEVQSRRLFFLLVSTFITAGAVSVSGVIGFVGLVVPHVLRILTGPDHRSLIPLSMVSGGIFLLLSDTLARTLLSPTEIPVGIITSIFGAPFFIYLLFRKRNLIP